MEGVVVSKETRSGTDFAPPKIIPGPLQVLNLDGIIFTKGETGEMDTHIHGSFVDTEGKVYGGHVMEEESIIATRLVVVIAEISEVSLTEQYDEESGHRLLHVEPL